MILLINKLVQYKTTTETKAIISQAINTNFKTTLARDTFTHKKYKISLA